MAFVKLVEVYGPFGFYQQKRLPAYFRGEQRAYCYGCRNYNYPSTRSLD